MLAQLQQELSPHVRLVFRPYPLDYLDKSYLAAQAAEAAGVQGEEHFFAMKDILFSQQIQWTDLTEEEFQDWAVEQAALLGLDLEKFSEDMLSRETRQRAVALHNAAAEIGIPGTPFLLINGTPYQGPRDYASLEVVAQLLILEQIQYTSCPDMVIDPELEYQATIETEKGEIVVQLFPDLAPVAVNSFVFLAREGWYDGTRFFRVEPGFIAQAGDPTNTGWGGPGYTYELETHPDLQFDGPGVVAIANSGSPNTNGSQFFITFGPAPQLDEGYTIIGRVVRGLEVLKNLTPRDPNQGGSQSRGDIITTIEIEER